MSDLFHALQSCRPFLSEEFSTEHQRLFHEEHLRKLARNLEKHYKEGPGQKHPAPYMEVECTPSPAEAFSPFEKFMMQWSDYGENEKILHLLAHTLEHAGCSNILVLLGQRFTPASLTDARAIPQPSEKLLESACLIHSSKLTMVARALTKHVNRSGQAFWGEVRGSAQQKNETSLNILQKILDNATWQNVFTHYKHEIVYEARIEAGYGARWGRDGQEFIGFLEPFTEGFPLVRE